MGLHVNWKFLRVIYMCVLHMYMWCAFELWSVFTIIMVHMQNTYTVEHNIIISPYWRGFVWA